MVGLVLESHRGGEYPLTWSTLQYMGGPPSQGIDRGGGPQGNNWWESYLMNAALSCDGSIGIKVTNSDWILLVSPIHYTGGEAMKGFDDEGDPEGVGVSQWGGYEYCPQW
jgi:hypothetical protein